MSQLLARKYCPDRFSSKLRAVPFSCSRHSGPQGYPSHTTYTLTDTQTRPHLEPILPTNATRFRERQYLNLNRSHWLLDLRVSEKSLGCASISRVFPTLAIDPRLAQSITSPIGFPESKSPIAPAFVSAAPQSPTVLTNPARIVGGYTTSGLF